MTNGTPIHLAPNDASGPLYPTDYVVWRTQIACDCCSSFYFNTQHFARYRLRSTLNVGKYITNLRPLKWPGTTLFNLPISIEERPQERVPFCHICNEPSLIGHPTVPADQPASAVVAGFTTPRTATTQEARKGGSTSGPRQPREKTLDDVFSML